MDAALHRFVLPSLALLAGLSSLSAARVDLSPSLPPASAGGIAMLSAWNPEKHPEIVDDSVTLRPSVGGAPADFRWVYNPGEPIRLDVAITRAAARAAVVFWDWNGAPVAVVPVPAPGTESIDVAVSGFGTWMVTVDLYGGPKPGSLEGRLYRSLAVVPDAASAREKWKAVNGYVLGSCFFPRRLFQWSEKWNHTATAPTPMSPDESLEALTDLAARAGFTVLRTDPFGADSARNLPADARLANEILEVMARHGLAAVVKVRVKTSPPCFIGETLEPDPDAYAAWEAEVQLLADEIIVPAGDSVAWVEIGNEPGQRDFWDGTMEQYAALYRAARQRLLAAKPGLTLTHGATCPPGANLAGESDAAEASSKAKSTEWYRGFYKELAPITDPWAYHFHARLDPSSLAWRTDEAAQLAAAGFKGRFLQTEGGRCPWKPGLETSGAAELLQKILHSWARGEMGWMQYALALHTGPSRYTEKNGWALLHGATLAPKFSYGATAALVATMAGCKPERILLDDFNEPSVFAAAFSHPQGKMLAIFGSPGGEIEVASDASAAELTDPMGNTRPLAGPAPFTIPLSPYPQYLLLKDATGLPTITHRKP